MIHCRNKDSCILKLIRHNTCASAMTADARMHTNTCMHALSHTYDMQHTTTTHHHLCAYAWRQYSCAKINANPTT